MDCWVGVDLGSHVDYAAVSVLARYLAIDIETGLPLRDSKGCALYDWRIRGMMRFPLRSPYSLIAQCVAKIASAPELRPRPRVCLDSTGVGLAVSETIRTALKPFPEVTCWGINITAGDTWRVAARYQLNCAKVQLTGALRTVMLDRLRYLRWPSGERAYGADVLDKELQAFKVKVSRAGNDIQGAESGSHDDMCLCVALPIWAGSLPFMHMRERDESHQPEYRSREAKALDTEEAAIELERLATEKAEREAHAASQLASWQVRRKSEQEIGDLPWDNPRWGD